MMVSPYARTTLPECFGAEAAPQAPDLPAGAHPGTRCRSMGFCLCKTMPGANVFGKVNIISLLILGFF